MAILKDLEKLEQCSVLSFFHTIKKCFSFNLKGDSEYEILWKLVSLLGPHYAGISVRGILRLGILN